MTAPAEKGGGSRFRGAAAVFFASASVMLLELSLFRAFSFSGYYHFSHLIIGTAMTGFGAGGCLVFFLRDTIRKDIDRFTLAASFLFASAAPLCLWGAAAVPVDIQFLIFSPLQTVLFFLQILLIFLPFFAAAALSGGLLYYHVSGIPFLYGVNLAAGGLAAAAAPALMTVVPPHLLPAAASMLPSAAFLSACLRPGCGRRKSLRAAGAVFVFACCAAALVFQREPRTDPYKSFAAFTRLERQGQAEKVLAVFGSRARIDVFRSPAFHGTFFAGPSADATPPPQLALLVDGILAGSIIAGAPGNDAILEHTPQSVPYGLVGKPRVLLLGDAGTANLRLAGDIGAVSVTLVQGDRNIVGALEGRTLGGMAPALPSFAFLVHDDPRRYLRRTSPGYDLIQIAAAEGLPAGTSGLRALHEDYLLTVEAVREMLELLSEDGILAVTRGIQSPPRDNVKMFALFAGALRSTGVADPGHHLLQARNYIAAVTVAAKRPLGPGAIAAFRRECDRLYMDPEYYPGMETPAEPPVNRTPGPAGKGYSYYHLAAREIAAGREREFFDSYMYDLRPPTDDRPYFHDFFRLASLRDIAAAAGPGWFRHLEMGYAVLAAAAMLAAAAGAALTALTVVPLLRRREPGLGPALLYFAGIGTAFMFLEIVFLRKFTLLLGDAAAGASVCLGSLLVFSGAGSAVQGKLKMDGGAKIRLAFAALLFWAVFFVLFSGPAFRALAAAPAFARAAAAAAWIGCAAFFMGWFFPAGTTLFAARENLFPAALAANGFSSVCASQLAAALAMGRGFTETIAWALAAYALCAAATLFGERKKTGRGEAAGAGARG